MASVLSRKAALHHSKSHSATKPNLDHRGSSPDRVDREKGRIHLTANKKKPLTVMYANQLRMC